MFIRLPVVALLVAGPCLVPIPAHAAAGYSASASSTGARLSLSNESVPLGLSPQLLAPTAEVTQTSLQQSDAYAALPSPGRDVGALPGTVLGGAGMTAPPYPFELTGAFGDLPKDLRYPGVALRTETREWLTRGSAVGGSPGAGASSDAWVERIDGAVSVGADSAVDGVRIGESLIINGLNAAATAARDSSGKLTRSSTLSFVSISAPGLELALPAPPQATGLGEKPAAPSIGFTNGTFTLTVPGAEPSSTPLPTNEVLAAFAAAGYTMTYQAPQETADGVIGAGLQIATTLPGPPPGSPGGVSGETPVTFSLGLARAEISYTKGTETAVAGVERAVPVGPPPAADIAAPVTEPPTALDAVVGPPVPATGFAPPAAAGVPTVNFATLTANPTPIQNRVTWVYLMVGAVGAAAIGSITLLRGVLR